MGKSIRADRRDSKADNAKKAYEKKKSRRVKRDKYEFLDQDEFAFMQVWMNR